MRLAVSWDKVVVMVIVVEAVEVMVDRAGVVVSRVDWRSGKQFEWPYNHMSKTKSVWI